MDLAGRDRDEIEQARADMNEMIKKQKRNMDSEALKGKLVVAESKKQGLPKARNFFRYIVRFGRAKYVSYIYSIILWIAVNIFFQLWCGIWVEDRMPGTDYAYWGLG
jgi:hypothetical protein